jgi:predicted MPP superfamily phosphohydrolase
MAMDCGCVVRKWIVKRWPFIFIWLALLIIMLAAGIKLIAVIIAFAMYPLYLLLWYPWARVLRDPRFPEKHPTSCCPTVSDCSCNPALSDRTSVSLKYVYILLVTMGLTSVALQSTMVSIDPNAYMVFSENLLGCIAVLLSACWFADILLFLSILLSFSFFNKRFPRRELWVKIRLTFTILLFIILSANSIHEGYRTPRVVEVHLPIANLPDCLDGFRLVMTSDVHVGPLVGRALIQQHVEQVNSLHPDAIVLVGDFTDGRTSIIGDALLSLQELRANGGVYFVTGNHEALNGGVPKDWVSFMQERNITTLENKRASVGRTGGHLSSRSSNSGSGNEDQCTFDLAGISDYSLDPNMTAAMEGRNSSRACVLLAHQPKEQTIVEAGRYGVGLMLSGHTHGGQTWPLHLATYMAQPSSFAGLFERWFSTETKNRLWLFVSEGYVGWGPRVRFGSISEVDVLVLRSPSMFELSGQSEPDTSPRASLVMAYLAIVLLACTVAWAIAIYGAAHGGCCIRVPLIVFAQEVYRGGSDASGGSGSEGIRREKLVEMSGAEAIVASETEVAKLKPNTVL